MCSLLFRPLVKIMSVDFDDKLHQLLCFACTVIPSCKHKKEVSPVFYNFIVLRLADNFWNDILRIYPHVEPKKMRLTPVANENMLTVPIARIAVEQSTTSLKELQKKFLLKWGTTQLEKLASSCISFLKFSLLYNKLFFKFCEDTWFNHDFTPRSNKLR